MLGPTAITPLIAASPPPSPDPPRSRLPVPAFVAPPRKAPTGRDAAGRVRGAVGAPQACIELNQGLYLSRLLRVSTWIPARRARAFFLGAPVRRDDAGISLFSGLIRRAPDPLPPVATREVRRRASESGSHPVLPLNDKKFGLSRH